MRPNALWSLALLCACEERPAEPQASPAQPPGEAANRAESAQPTSTEGPTKPAQTPAQPGEILWDKPAAWQEAKSASAMRLATYTIPRAEGDPEDGELSVIPSGGTVEQNVDRWKAQFELEGEAKQTTREVGKLKVTVVELHGTQKPGGMMPGMGPSEPRTGWAMLAAIVETEPRMHFFKLTGPKKTVEAAKADFESLVGSIRPK